MWRQSEAGSKTNYGEKSIIAHTEEGLSLRIQRVDAKKVLGSVHKMNIGGNVVVLGGERSYVQKRRRTRRQS